MKKILTTTAISLFVVVLVALIIAPPIIRNYLVKNSTELIGRQISLDELKLNYFRMSVDLHDFVMYEEDGKTPFVSFDQLYVNLAPWYLFSSELVIQELLLDGMKVNMIQHDSTFNFDDIIAYHTRDQLEPPDSVNTDTSQSAPFKFHLSNLELKNGDFYFVDSVVGEDIEMVNLNLFVPYIGWNQDETSDAGLKFFFANGGYFQSSFQMDPVSGVFDAEVTIDDLELGTFYGYTTRYLAVDTIQGMLNTYLQASGNTNFLDSLNIDGWLDLSELKLTSNGERDLASVDSLYCTIEELRPLMKRFLIDTLVVVKPAFSFELYESSNNLFDLFTWLDETESDLIIDDDTIAGSVSDPDYPLYYALNSFEIKEGDLTFIDYQYDSVFYYHLNKFELAVDSITSDAAWLDATASMSLNNRGNLIAEIGLDPSNPLELDLQYAISEFRLSDLNIYVNHYIGHDIVFGDLYYTSDTKIRSGQIESDNKLTIRDIEISKIKGGLMTLPLKMALFILKDKDGDAVLEVPVRGDLNDPNLTISKLIWTTFKNFIGRVATAPYHFLAGLVSADPSDLKDIEFDFADTTLSPKRQRQLDLLLELEEKKAGLDIQLAYFVDMEIEKNEIALKMAGDDFYKKTSKDYRDHESEFLLYLQSKAKNDTLSITDAALLLFDPVKLDSLAAQFSQYRVHRLQSFLQNKSDSTNIRVHSFHAKAPMNVGSAPFFKVEYAILGDEESE